MTINEYITKIENTDAKDYTLTQINKRVVDAYQQYYRSFLSYPLLVDLEKENHQKTLEVDINKQLVEITRTYREDVLKVSPDYKREGMLVWSYSGLDLTDEVGKLFNFNFNKKSYKDRVRMKYSREKLVKTMVLALAFLFAKYKEVTYIFHIQATFLKVLVDFFDYTTIEHKELFGVYNDITNMDINIIVEEFKKLDFKKKPTIKRKDRKPRKRVEMPTKEQFETWLSSGQYSRTQLEEIVAKQLHVSAITIHRKLVEYGLVRKYNKK